MATVFSGLEFEDPGIPQQLIKLVTLLHMVDMVMLQTPNNTTLFLTGNTATLGIYLQQDLV